MGIIELFLLAVGLSMDAFAVSVCKGLAMPKITVKKASVVGLWFGGFQALMPLVGYFLGVQFKDKITAIDHWIAFILLGIIGFNMIREALSPGQHRCPGYWDYFRFSSCRYYISGFLYRSDNLSLICSRREDRKCLWNKV